MNVRKSLYAAQRLKFGAGAKFQERNTSANQNKIMGRGPRGSYFALMAMILGWGAAAQAQSVHGIGTTNTIPLWTSSTTVGNSLIKQSGNGVSVTGGFSASGAINA